MNNLFVWIWAALALIFFIAEIFTAGFFLVCFGIGAVAAVILAVLNFDVIWQLVAFIAVSLVALAFLRPMAMRMAYTCRQSGRHRPRDWQASRCSGRD